MQTIGSVPIYSEGRAARALGRAACHVFGRVLRAPLTLRGLWLAPRRRLHRLLVASGGHWEVQQSVRVFHRTVHGLGAFTARGSSHDRIGAVSEVVPRRGAPFGRQARLRIQRGTRN